MISALRGSFLYPFDVVLKIFGFRFSLGGCHEKVEISMKMLSFHEQIEISRKSRDFMKKDSSLLAVDVCFQVFRAVPCARGWEKALRVPRAVNFG